MRSAYGCLKEPDFFAHDVIVSVFCRCDRHWSARFRWGEYFLIFVEGDGDGGYGDWLKAMGTNFNGSDQSRPNNKQ